MSTPAPLRVILEDAVRVYSEHAGMKPSTARVHPDDELEVRVTLAELGLVVLLDVAVPPGVIILDGQTSSAW